ncbi:anti-sigma factor family protein [Archangium lansingense]|uniref:Zf-HC2 domain-containing protein n=1 Tax=Archangium lansingense TaxID=2995310 RepID=A0ABT4ANZ6_9BACT|nr:zf-HC2 domain-containing protein [Archangium lansinium]MCY1083001.1 zf-HC2 domain-containing protein [Archangium lansinium]
MSTPCRESDLDALLAGELSPEEAERVSAHAASCATCTRALAWLRTERGWMAQRARRMPSRPALSFEALEARLRPTPAPRQARREHRGGLVAMMGAAAAVAFMALSMMPRSHQTSLSAFASMSSEDAWSEGLISIAQVPACMDPSVEAVARVEARFGACLLASPAQPLP